MCALPSNLFSAQDGNCKPGSRRRLSKQNKKVSLRVTVLNVVPELFQMEMQKESCCFLTLVMYLVVRVKGLSLSLRILTKTKNDSVAAGLYSRCGRVPGELPHQVAWVPGPEAQALSRAERLHCGTTGLPATTTCQSRLCWYLQVSP